MHRIFAFLGCVALVSVIGPAHAERITVFAAASLQDGLADAAKRWERVTGDEVVLNFGGSSLLARQLQQGAAADIYISASVAWMDVVEKAGEIDPATRRDLLLNRLVLIAHGKEAEPVTIDKTFDLAAMLGDDRLAMAFTDAVPAGIYGRLALTSLGQWEAVQPLVAQLDTVRSALAIVARGEAPFGIVYATDAVASDNVTVVATFPESSHPPIVYPAAVMKTGSDDARAFLLWMASGEGVSSFTKFGFKVP